MKLSVIKKIVHAEFNEVNQTILKSLHSSVPTIEKVGHYLVKSGGKRIRPLLHMLSAKACGGPHHTMIQLAAIIEFIHTATLLHDDVVDGSNLRRGQPTANAVWDNATAVLVGDFVYSRAFQMMVSLECPKVMTVLSETTNVIAEGEVLQLQRKGNPKITEAEYFKIIECKTAKLFEAASVLGAIIGDSPDMCDGMATYGMELGIAFQIVDDILDYQANEKHFGKNLGDDLAEGKVTLPLLHALNNSPTSAKKHIQAAIKAADISQLDVIKEAIVKSNSIQYAINHAKLRVDNALSALSILADSPYKNALTDLALFALNRIC